MSSGCDINGQTQESASYLVAGEAATGACFVWRVSCVRAGAPRHRFLHWRIPEEGRNRTLGIIAGQFTHARIRHRQRDRERHAGGQDCARKIRDKIKKKREYREHQGQKKMNIPYGTGH